MVQATAYLSQDIRARRIAFLEAGETLNRAEREELSELRTAGHEYRPHVERSTDEIKATLAYQRRILGEQSRCVRVSAKSSLAAIAIWTFSAEGGAIMVCHCLANSAFLCASASWVCAICCCRAAPFCMTELLTEPW